MRPILFSILGLDVQAYGVSKALAALAAALLLARAFESRGLNREHAYPLVLWSTVFGFAGAKAYYLLEHLPTLSVHDLGSAGFTWYGGLVSGAVTAVLMVRRWRLPLGEVAGASAVPLSVAYAIGRLGCLLAGDGTYGRPTTLPWGMRFPHGVVATDVPVHPTPLYEAAGALVIALALWRIGRRVGGPALFACYLVLSGVARFLVEFLRTNQPVLLGLTQPQLWAAAGTVVGATLLIWTARRPSRGHTSPAHAPLPGGASTQAGRHEAGARP